MLFTWLTTIKQVDAGTLVVERMELDESGFPQPTGELDELAADSLVLALGQETDLSLLDGVDRPGGRATAWWRSDPDMMTGPPGRLRRRRHGARRALGDRRRSGTASGRPRNIDAWLSGAAPEPPEPARALADVRRR